MQPGVGTSPAGIVICHESTAHRWHVQQVMMQTPYKVMTEWACCSRSDQIGARDQSTWSKTARCALQCTSPSGCSACTISGEGALSGWQQLRLRLQSADAVEQLAAPESSGLLAGLLSCYLALHVLDPHGLSHGPETCTRLNC